MLIPFTVFWQHPTEGAGSHIRKAPTAQLAGENALDEVVCNLAEDPENRRETDDLANEIDLSVYEGEHLVRPDTAPAFQFD